MSDYPKKIHECFKRTLIFESGKKLARPVAICFFHNFSSESNCAGTREASPEEQREFKELYSYYPNGSRCASCPFLKSGEYISDALRIFKTFGMLCLQETCDASERLKSNFLCSCIDGFLRPLIDKVKLRCYLTFGDSEKRMATNKLNEMDFNQVFNLIEKMEMFCKENNIK